jgi:hypothetical protein
MCDPGSGRLLPPYVADMQSASHVAARSGHAGYTEPRLAVTWLGVQPHASAAALLFPRCSERLQGCSVALARPNCCAPYVTHITFRGQLRGVESPLPAGATLCHLVSPKRHSHYAGVKARVAGQNDTQAAHCPPEGHARSSRFWPPLRSFQRCLTLARGTGAI